MANNQETDGDKEKGLQQVNKPPVNNRTFSFKKLLRFTSYLLLIPGFILLNTIHSPETRVRLEIAATNVTWKVHIPEGEPTEEIVWEMISEDTVPQHIDNATITNLSDNTIKPYGEPKIDLLKTDSAGYFLLKDITIANRCQMSLAVNKSQQTKLTYLWEDTGRVPVLESEYKYLNKQLLIRNISSTLISSSEQGLITQKQLAKGSPYYIYINKIVPWRLNLPINVSELSFMTEPRPNPRERSSVLSGTIRLLSTGKDTIPVQEGYKVVVKFKQPVQLFISADNEKVRVQAEGMATELKCGTIPLDSDHNIMPLLLKQWTDQSPLLLGILTALVPVIIELIIRQKKST